MTRNGQKDPSQEMIDEFVGVAHGDLERVKELLAAYPALVQARASWNESAVEAAAQTGQVEIAKLLLAAGAQPDICTAAMMGHQDQVVSFLQADPSLISATGAHGIPLLYFPAISGHPEIAELLWTHGANVNAGEGGNTPLHGAVLFYQPAMVRWLLDQGAKNDPLDYNGRTPLQLAEENNQADIIEILHARS